MHLTVVRMTIIRLWNECVHKKSLVDVIAYQIYVHFYSYAMH